MSVLQQFLATMPADMQAHIRVLDKLVRKAAPDLTPSLKWGNLTYHHTKNVCSLVAHQQHVNLQLWAGAALPDPDGLLVGTGKQMRHVKLPVGQPFRRRSLTAIVRAAAAASRA